MTFYDWNNDWKVVPMPEEDVHHTAPKLKGKSPAKLEAKVRLAEIRSEARTARQRARWDSDNVENLVWGAAAVVLLSGVLVLITLLALNTHTPAEMVSNCLKAIPDEIQVRPEAYPEYAKTCEIIDRTE